MASFLVDHLKGLSSPSPSSSPSPLPGSGSSCALCPEGAVVECLEAQCDLAPLCAHHSREHRSRGHPVGVFVPAAVPGLGDVALELMPAPSFFADLSHCPTCSEAMVLYCPVCAKLVCHNAGESTAGTEAAAAAPASASPSPSPSIFEAVSCQSWLFVVWVSDTNTTTSLEKKERRSR